MPGSGAAQFVGRSKVTLVLTEADARWLADYLNMQRVGFVILHEIKHALAECACTGEETL